ncbi:MAG: Tll0287-like domain-containing protein [Halothiobacillaceae bacterium]
MKKTAIALALALGATTAVQASDAIEQQIDQYKAAMMDFGKQLRGELQSAMKEGGPPAAIDVCHSRAPEIAQQVSDKHGVMVSRTSLKPRAEAPDAWERAVLEKFEEQKAAGKPVAEIAYFEVVDVDGTDELRFMKAIGTDTVCLTCHGTDVDAKLKEKIVKLYPEDQAMGFKEGDIRGAFSISAKAP